MTTTLSQGTSSVGIQPNVTDTNTAMVKIMADFQELNLKVKVLESTSRGEKETFKYILKNERLIYWILLLFPLALLVTSVFTLKSLGVSIPPLLAKITLSIISISTILELLYLPLKIKDYAKRVETLEDEFKKIKAEMDISS